MTEDGHLEKGREGKETGLGRGRGERELQAQEMSIRGAQKQPWPLRVVLGWLDLHPRRG